MQIEKLFNLLQWKLIELIIYELIIDYGPYFGVLLIFNKILFLFFIFIIVSSNFINVIM